MKRLIFIILALLALVQASPARQAEAGESVLLVGGPSLYQWEKYKAYPHDHWWANFVRAARLRTEQLRGQVGPDAKITWLIYKQGYIDRASQEHQDLIALIDSVREKFNINVVYFQRGSEVINYLNAGQPRDRMKIVDFEYFGHSNKACFMFDYSSNLDSAAKSWLHESELSKINRKIFARNAYVKSWGCHTGESMSTRWYNATGTHMIGAIGKTQFMMEELPILTSQNGRWVN
ncbi:MAG: hypothetical protein ABI925_08230 [Verrucomicrobiota bacterium]